MRGYVRYAVLISFALLVTACSQEPADTTIGRAAGETNFKVVSGPDWEGVYLRLVNGSYVDVPKVAPDVGGGAAVPGLVFKPVPDHICKGGKQGGSAKTDVERYFKLFREETVAKFPRVRAADLNTIVVNQNNLYDFTVLPIVRVKDYLGTHPDYSDLCYEATDLLPHFPEAVIAPNPDYQYVDLPSVVDGFPLANSLCGWDEESFRSQNISDSVRGFLADWLPVSGENGSAAAWDECGKSRGIPALGYVVRIGFRVPGSYYARRYEYYGVFLTP
jgi:hypothetical protein